MHKKLALVLFPILCLFASCAVATQGGLSSQSPLPDVENPSSSHIATTSPSPSSGAYPAPPKDDMLVFDPLNPEGWSVWNWDDDGLNTYNEGLYIDYSKDFFVGEFYGDMTLEEAIPHFASKSYRESEQTINEDIIEKRIILDGITLMFWNLSIDKGFTLYAFEICSGEYATARALRVGDVVERVYELYGTPAHVQGGDDENSLNEWHYLDEDRYRTPCHVIIEDGAVKSIYLALPF